MVIRVLIVDDNAPFLRTLKRYLTMHEGIEVVGAFESALNIQKQIENLQPDAVITDLDMPDILGVTVIRELRQCYPHLTVIALTFHDSPEYRIAAEDAGAHGFITKASLDKTLIPVLKKALRNSQMILEV